MYGFQSFYFFFFLLYFSYVFILISFFKRQRKSWAYFIIVFFPLFILSALRSENVGGDLRNYLPGFYDICKANSFSEMMESGWEPGYTILNKLIGFISTDSSALLFFTSLFSLIGPCYLIYKYSNNVFLSIIMFCMMGYYTNTFNIVRQSIAVSCFFVSWPYLLSRSKKYYLFALAATTMHYSALVLFLIPPLFKREINIKRVFLIFCTTITAYVLLGSSILNSLILMFFSKHDPDKVLEEMSGTGWNLLILYFVIFVFFYTIYILKEKNVSPGLNNFLKLFIILQMLAVIFQLFATMYSTVMRIGLYFYIPIIISFPYFYSLVKTPLIKIFLFFLVIFLCVFFFYSTYSYDEGVGSNGQGVIPYELIL